MADSAVPLASKHLPSAVFHSATAGTALLRMETTRSRVGVLDGAWWPRSRDVAIELPALVSALTEYIGPITRIGLDVSAWNGLPARLVLDGRVVHIDSSATGDDTVLVTRGDQDHFSLLVVPSDATEQAARAAMEQAVQADNSASAEQILIEIRAERDEPN